MKKIIYFALFAQSILHANAQNNIPDSLFGINSNMQVNTVGGESGGNFMVQPDGKIIYGGYDYDINQNDFHYNMMRFDVCGVMDTTFGVNGLSRYKFDQRNIGYDYKLQADGKIVVAGLQAATNSGSGQISGVSRFNSNGSPDTTFNHTGSRALRYDNVSSGRFYSLDILQDGRIVCMGKSANNINGGVPGFGAMRFLPNGALDSTFSGDGKVVFTIPGLPSHNRVNGHLIQNKKIVLTCLAFAATNSQGRFCTAQFDSTGTLDTTYGFGGYFIDSIVPPSGNLFSEIASAVDASGNLYLAGSSDVSSIDVMRLSPQGKIDTTFAIGGYLDYSVANTTVKSMRILANGNILIQGAYAIGFGFGFGLMLLPSGVPDVSFGMNGFRSFDLVIGSGTNSLDALLELPNGKWLAASSGNAFNFKKFANQSDVPHISENIGVLSTTGIGTYQWYLDSLPISGANAGTYTAIQNGSYTVLLTNAEGCSYLSNPYNVVDVGISEQNGNSKFTVFPNPVIDRLKLSGWKLTAGDEVRIYNLIGKELVAQKNLQEGVDINVADLSEGIYLLKIKKHDQTRHAKFVKQ
jgi:uncharacterized delta-60 repeat protein